MLRNWNQRKGALFVLLSILAVGAFFRLQNTNWDSHFHLHPDERFLAMVANDTRLPDTIQSYLSQDTSPLNPRNVKFDFFVYGTFPITLVKTFAALLDKDAYGPLTIIGRTIMALIDACVILVVFKSTQLFAQLFGWSKKLPYWAAFAYATFVLPIQLSHFFTSDPIVTFCIALALYLGYTYSKKPTLYLVAASGVVFGIALSAKLNALLTLPSIIVLFSAFEKLWQIFTKRQWSNLPAYAFKLLGRMLLFALCAYVTVRLGDPYVFASASIFDPTIEPRFLANIAQLKLLEKPDAQFPPAIQWLTTEPILFPLNSLIFWGIGIPASLLAVVGLIPLYKSRKKILAHPEILLSVLGMIAVFLYQGMQFAKAMRYFYLLYPLLAILVGLGAVQFYQLAKKTVHKQVLFVVLSSALLLWPLMFSAIYQRPHSRITASTWLANNLPENATVLVEHWDDALPLSGTAPDRPDLTMLELPVFDPDTQAKEDTFARLTAEADVIVLSSNRGWGSIGTVPERFPFTSRWYGSLLSNRSEFRKVAEFTSYPSLDYLGIPLTFPDDASEEFFTVYDHPKVMVFMKRSQRPVRFAQ